MDVRIGVTNVAREVTLDIADDQRDVVVKAIEAALGGTVDSLWLTDRRGRTVVVASSKLGYVDLGADEAGRRIGFGG